MRAETQANIAAIEKSLGLLAKRMDRETAAHRLEEFDARVEDPTLWDDPAAAQKLMRERQDLLDKIGTYDQISQGLRDNVELIEMGETEGDDEIVSEAEAALKALRQTAGAKELEALLDGEADGNDTFLEINAGAGGTEACDWAAMLQRMFVRWAEKKGYEVEMQSEEAGAEAGTKSVAYKISGPNAYGWLKSESGVHRLVRISPFGKGTRETSFASVWVYPVVDDNIDIEVNPSDIRVDTYRSSGAGGQHVNTTDSAVRITHHPTGIVVTSSGAAYGYHPDNPVPLTEDAPCRGNPEFAYADHKRQVEEMLAEVRATHPALEQVVLRVRDRHQLATVMHVDFGLDETTYDLMVNRAVGTDDLATLGAHETARRTWEVEDIMATMCRLKRTEIGCEETCSSCALNPDSAAGSTLQQHLSALD